MSPDLHAAIRAWANGILPTMAGAELLIRSGWADRLDASWYDRSEDGRYARPNLDTYLTGAGYLSGGEYRQLTIIASFLGQLARYNDTESVAKPFDMQLYEMLPGVDGEFIRLVMTAVGHAAGLHERGRGGDPLPWPDEP